jgi:pimeloyl-ACP methyl ester carboxylesterase
MPPTTVSSRPASQPIAKPSLSSIDEATERRLLQANDNQGHLVDVYDGSANRGTTVTVHGINASPDAMRQLAQTAQRRGQDVKTFVYDDRKTRLGETSQDLAQALTALRQQQKGRPLTIQAHSLGGRVTVDALRKMQQSGVLGGDVKLELINPVLGGLDSANSAKLAPGLVAGLIPGVNPGKDMGTKSAFQKELETTQLPKNVKTTVMVGDRDHLVDPKTPHFQAVVDGLNARLVNLAGADHNSALERVAAR